MSPEDKAALDRLHTLFGTRSDAPRWDDIWVAIRLARQANSAPPEGWVTVPREPSDETIRAIEFAIYRYSDCSVRDAERGAPRAFQAMLAAAPTPEKD